MVERLKQQTLYCLLSVSTDVNLEPYTTYEYRVSAWNSYGRGFSKAVRASTAEDVPQGLNPPRWSTVGSPERAIVLSWKEPLQSNGMKLLKKSKLKLIYS